MFGRKNSIFFPCLLCTFLWGLGYPVLKMACTAWDIAQNDIPSKLLFAGTRFFLSGLLLLCVSWIKKGYFPKVTGKILYKLCALGLCQTTLQYALLYVGLANTSGTKGSVINQFCVFLTVLLTPLFFKSEKCTIKKIIGCLIGFSGIIIMNLDGVSLKFEYGDLIVLLASCATTAGYLLSKAMPLEYDALTSTGYQQVFGGLILIVLGFSFGGRIHCDSFMDFCLLAYLIIECAVAFSLWFNMLQHNDASTVTIYKFLTPIFGVLFSGILLGEKIINAVYILSLVLVCLGVIIINGFTKGRKPNVEIHS